MPSTSILLCVVLILLVQWTSNTMTVLAQDPSAPVITQIIPSPRSMTINWTQNLNDTVLQFIIHYVFDIKLCTGIDGFNDIIVSNVMSGSLHYQYELTGLEENSDFSVHIETVTATGSTEGETVLTSTLPDDPSGSPNSVVFSDITSTGFTVTWGTITCQDRNTEITAYIVTVIETETGITADIVRVEDVRSYTATGLIPRTNYTVSLAGQNLDFATITSYNGVEGFHAVQTASVSAPGFFHAGMLLPNNSIISSIDINGLFCVTNSDDNGDWFLPGSSDPVQGVMRRAGAVILRTASPGVYLCQISNVTLYAGVGLGSPLIIIALIRNESALICFSAGRPVDSVVWSDNGAIIDFANSNFSSQQDLIGNLQAAYANVLYKEDGKLEGSYTCQLDDADPDSDPVSWTYTVNDITIISDQFVIGSRGVALCSSSVDSIFIDSIQWLDENEDTVANSTATNQLVLVIDPVNDSVVLQGAEFTCSVTSQGSTATQSFQVSIISPENPLDVFTVGLPEEPLAGSSFTITCTATETYPGYLMMPTAMWLNSDEEEPSGEDISITSSQNDTSAKSMLTFNSLRLTDAAEFTCIGKLTSFINTEVRQSYTLVVLIPATTITVANSSGSNYLGQSAEFACTAGPIIDELNRGNIIGRFTWLLNGTELVSDDHYRITAAGYLVSRLTVFSLSFMENIIKCSATIYSDVNSDIESQPSSDSLSVSFGLGTPSANIAVYYGGTDLFTGLRFNLACQINYPVIRGTPLTVEITWTKDGEQLLSNNSITINRDILQVSPGVYEQNLTFHSLELSDEGVYSCLGSVTVNSGDYQMTRLSPNANNYTLSIPMQCFQFRVNDLGGTALDCINILTQVPGGIIQVPPLIFSSFAAEINDRCNQCGFSENSVTDAHAQCFENNPNDATVYGKLQAAFLRNIAEIEVLMGLIDHVRVQFFNETYEVDGETIVSIGTSLEGDCVAFDNTVPITTEDQSITTQSTTTEEEPIATQSTDQPVVTTQTTDQPVVATQITDQPVVATQITDQPVVATQTTDQPISTLSTDQPVTAQRTSTSYRSHESSESTLSESHGPSESTRSSESTPSESHGPSELTRSSESTPSESTRPSESINQLPVTLPQEKPADNKGHSVHGVGVIFILTLGAFSFI